MREVLSRSRVKSSKSRKKWSAIFSVFVLSLLVFYPPCFLSFLCYVRQELALCCSYMLSIFLPSWIGWGTSIFLLGCSRTSD